MSYLTLKEIEEAFGEGELRDLADRDADGFADPDFVHQAISRAGGLIDSYLRSRYPVPLSERPDMVREIALAIVRYQLSENHATDRVKEDYERALTWLKEIRDGKMDLGLTQTGQESPANTGGPAISGGRPVFNRDALDHFAGEDH
ncbi:MAG: DUF1320 domain-containing protein [Pseudomonadota bacterium]